MTKLMAYIAVGSAAVAGIVAGGFMAQFQTVASGETLKIPNTGESVTLSRLPQRPDPAEIPKGLESLSIGGYRYHYNSRETGAFMECNVTINGNGQPPSNGRLSPHTVVKAPPPVVFCARPQNF